MKKISLIFGMAALFIAGKIDAQTGTLTGWGMATCQQYSFTVCPGTIITPLNYGRQNFVCRGAQHEDVSFVNMGGSWRVEALTWDFSATLSGATVTGVDPSNLPVTLSLNAGDQLEPLSYTTIGAIVYVTFSINNVSTGILMNRTNFQIALTAASPAAFTLTTGNGTVSGNSTAIGTHVWNVYSTTNGIGAPLTFIGTFNTPSFTVNNNGPCYYVQHTVTTQQCGQSCAAQTICTASCQSGNPKSDAAGLSTTNAIESVNRLDVFPNPTNGMVSFEITTQEEEALSIFIFDINGKCVQTLSNVQTKDKKGIVTWNTESLSSGTYLVKVVTASNQEMNKKMIIE